MGDTTIMNDAMHHESYMEDNEVEDAAMLPPPPPPPHIKLLDRRCLDCVIHYLDSESTKSMAQSCRFLSDACAAADCMPVIGMENTHHLSDVAPAQSSFDALDEPSNKDSQDLVHMQYDNSAQAFISDNPAPSFDEIDEIKGAALPSRDRLSLDDGMKQDYDGGIQACISDDLTPSFNKTDDTKNAVSLHAANGANAAESEGAEELSEVVSPSAGNTFKPLSMNSLKSFHTPTRERRSKTPESAFTPSMQNSSDDDDSESANYDEDDSISDSETVQFSNQETKEAEETEEVYSEKATPGPSRGTFGSFISHLMGDIIGSAKEVTSDLTLDKNVRRNNIDDRGPIKIGDKLYSHNEALKMWKKAKRNLEETYAEVDASGNDKFDTTSFFEKSSMYKENATRVRDKRKSRSKKPTNRSSTKQGGSLSAAQERSLKKLMMKVSLQEEDESIIASVTQKSTQTTVVSEKVESDNSKNGSRSCPEASPARSSSSTDSSSNCSSSATSSVGRNEYNPSLLTSWLPNSV